MAFLQTTAASISSGGTINGDITIEGDLTVNGDGSGNYDEIVNGNIVISSGNSLGVGTDNPSTEVHVVSTGTAQVRIQSGNYQLRLLFQVVNTLYLIIPLEL